MKMKRVLSLLLALVMTMSLVTLPSYAEDEAAAALTVTMDGKAVDAVTLPQGGKVELKAQADAQVSDYCWQINIGKEMWVDISGETGSTIQVSYAMVASLLSDNKVALRCKTDAGVSNAVTVTVTAPKVEHQAATFSVPRANAALMAAPANGAGETPSTYNVVINYMFENNQIVADPYTASLAAGSSFSATVTFPTVQGYLPYVNETQQNSLELNYAAINQDYTYNVVYKPTNVNYTVIHYQQNLNDDNYTEKERETKQGLTNSTVPEVAKTTYEGFYALLYEKPAIAADGSTVVEVYYDRYYYLMNFDLDGGYGVEPIYARYDTPIGDVGTPTKAGYSFSGWSLDGTNLVSLPETMPAESRTYKAVWEADNTAKVTVVFWGENADNEEYSYIKSAEVNVKPETEFTYNESGSLICALEVHTHNLAECYTLTCRQEEHTHSESCYTCGQSSHTHDTSCYAGVGSADSPLRPPANPSNGQIYKGDIGFYSWSYIYINGKWYNYSGSLSNGSIAPTACGKTESTHTHTDDCIGCGKSEHTHSIENGCYTLTCGKTAHTHNSNCYMSGAGLDSNLWTFKESDTVTVAADGSTVVNVYYDRTEFTLTFRANNNTVATITDKWGADISDEFNKAPFNTTYNGRAWDCTDSSKYSYALQTLDRMPKFDATFTLHNKSSNKLKTIYYYVENVGADVSENTWPTSTSTSNFTLLKTVQTYFNYATYNEEYHEIEGFTRYSRQTAGFDGDNRKEFSNNTLYLYYLRNDYNLTFNDGYSNLKTESVQYQKILGAYSFTPDVPKAYEAGSVVFGGWYLNPECSGDEYVLNEHTMPLGNLILYAKWVPVTHKVEFYLDRAALNAGTKLGSHPDITVPHGSKVTDVANPTNGSYTFVGWFYMENGVEKAFDFANMPVTKDMQVYGKWSSNVLKQYTIYYKIQDTDTEIAAPTTGSALAGVTKTFEAKGGTDLYANYQEGYFPVTKSHSLTLDINATEENDTNVYTFWYAQKEAVPYTVKYLNKETGEPLAGVPEKTVSDNRKAVVTETFVPVSGMMPDAYQKRLVVSVKEDGNPDTEHNVIIFYYTEDTTHAYYKITHYTENLAKDAQGNTTWTEYASSQAVGDIGETYNANPMTIPGFTYDSSVAGTVTSGELSENGLELRLYYTRKSYPYQVRYLEQGTGNQLADPKNGTGKYGQVVSESAIDIANYTAVAPTSQTLNIRIEESSTEAKLNIITFYYKEQEVTINYQVVGPAGCGTVSSTSETLKVLSGTAQGSTATAKSDDYKFVGWYSDPECQNPVPAAQVAGNKFTPAKDTASGLYVPATYYAKFEWNVADLTITKKAAQGTTIDNGQSFIFHVTGDGVDMYVTVQGAGSVTVKGLKVGSYTVEEVTTWSWRYTPDGSAKRTVSVQGGQINEEIFHNTRTNPYWLSGDSFAVNTFDMGPRGTFVSGN